jgi:hypothetical protein
MAKLNFKYPEISVKLPQSGNEFTVRCLKTFEVDTLKHSILSPIQALISVNEIVYNVIQNKPDYIKTYQDYIKNTTSIDRDALIYAMYNVTFGNNKTFKVSCERCQKEQQIRLELDKCYSIEPYPYSSNLIKSYDVVKIVEKIEDEELEKAKKDIEDKKNVNEESADDNTYNIISRVEKIKLNYAENAYAFIKQPTVKEELDAVQRLTFSEDIHISEVIKCLFVSKFEGEQEDGQNVVITDPNDILESFNDLHIADRNMLNQKYYELFGKYKSSVETTWKCLFCTSENELEIDIPSQFFRMVQTA